MPTTANGLTWYAAADGAQSRPKAAHWKKPMQIVVDAGTGTVEVQIPTAEHGTFVTPGDAEFTMSADGAYVFDRANGLPLQIVATGNAQFAFLDD